MMNDERKTNIFQFRVPRSAFIANLGGGKSRTCDLAIINRLLGHLSFATSKLLAAEFGFEPKYTASKAGVLPVGRLRKKKGIAGEGVAPSAFEGL
jgi:hypothetical protein